MNRNPDLLGDEKDIFDEDADNLDTIPLEDEEDSDENYDELNFDSL